MEAACVDRKPSPSPLPSPAAGRGRCCFTAPFLSTKYREGDSVEDPLFRRSFFPDVVKSPDKTPGILEEPGTLEVLSGPLAERPRAFGKNGSCLSGSKTFPLTPSLSRGGEREVPFARRFFGTDQILMNCSSAASSLLSLLRPKNRSRSPWPSSVLWPPFLVIAPRRKFVTSVTRLLYTAALAHFAMS
jgi:hypothetical protein